MTSFDDQTQVGGQSTTVASAGSLLVGVWCRHIVREFSGALEHLSLIIRAICIFYFFCHCTGFIGSVRYTNEITPSDAVQRVTCGANFAVDLVTPSNAVFQRDKLVVPYNQQCDRAAYLAWSNESNQPLCDHGYAAGCNPSSARPLACTSPMNGSVPYKCVYQAIDPTVKAESDATVAREFANALG